jgi:hypothetical protein
VVEDAGAAYLRTRSTNSFTCVSIEGSRVGFSLPEYWYVVRMCALILDLVHGLTHSSSHLLPPSIMTLVITFSEHVIFPRFKSCGMVKPRRPSIRRSHSIDLGPELGVTGNQMVWRNSRNRTFFAVSIQPDFNSTSRLLVPYRSVTSP